MKKYFMLFATGVTVFCLASCNTVEFDTGNPNIPEDETEIHICQMIFNGEVSGFDGIVTKTSDQTKAATSSSWADGDIVCHLLNGATTVSSQATYTTDGGWNVRCDGNLSTGSGLKCEVRCFLNATFQSTSLVSLNSETEIYEALNGTYDYSGSRVTLTQRLAESASQVSHRP